MTEEGGVFDGEERCNHRFRNAVDGRALRVLHLEYTDLLPIHVVNDAALGKTGELGEVDGDDRVAVQHSPCGRCHGRHHGGDEECSGDDGDREPNTESNEGAHYD